MTGVAGERGWLVSTEQVILFTWLLKSSSAEVALWWAFTWDTNIFIFFAHSERSVHIPLPQISLSPFSNHVLSSSLIIRPNHCSQPMNWYVVAHLPISPSKQSEQPGALLTICSQGGFPFTLVFQGCPWKGPVLTGCPLSGGACLWYRTICRPGRGLFFLYHLIIGNSPSGHRLG